MSDCSHSNAAESLKIQMSSSADQDDEVDPGTCCPDPYYRRLSIASIVCGCSCIGIMALISSVRAEEAPNRTTAQRFSRRARKLAMISMLVLFVCLGLAPVLMALISYLITLRE